MKLLILGGTAFLGRHLAESAAARGHRVTLFNRGRRNPGLFQNLERLMGDRNSDLSALGGRSWDAAIDTSGYFPRQVRASAEALARAVGHYTFISSLSVYADQNPAGIDEAGALAQMPAGKADTGEITAETYGPLKVACEQAAIAALPGRALVIRPGLIVGPYDPSDRFTYWPTRVARGGEVLAPGRPERPVQFIDVRDLAEWNLQLVEAGATGTYNATGPAERLAFGDFLAVCQSVTGGAASFTWVPDDLLVAHNVAPYTELPLWIPAEGAGPYDTFGISRALQAGLTFRPLADTIRATYEWDRTRPAEEPRRNGLAPEREAALLAEWRVAGGAAPP
jgi:2'-hydroxyisoflavone reductase